MSRFLIGILQMNMSTKKVPNNRMAPEKLVKAIKPLIRPDQVNIGKQEDLKQVICFFLFDQHTGNPYIKLKLC